MSTQTVGLWPAAVPLMTSVQPWTYRDTLTATELLHQIAKQLERLSKWAVEISASYEILDKRISEVEAKTLAEVKKEAEKLREEMASMKSELLALIAEVSVGGSSYDPTDGTDHKPVSVVIERVYDYLRTSALFVAEADGMGLTVAEMDAREIPVRQTDLDPEFKTDHAAL